MRSKSIDYRLNINTPVAGYDRGQFDVFKDMTVKPDGTVEIHTFPSTEIEKFHLDTDDGWERFVKLIQKSTRLDTQDDVKHVLGLITRD